MFEPGLNNSRIRSYNKRVLLTLIYQHKQVSKSLLATQTGLSIPAVGNILEELLAERLIDHLSEGLSKRGVSGGSYQIAQNNRLILCMNVTPTGIESLTVDSRIMPQETLCSSGTEAPHPQALLQAIERIYHARRKQFSGWRIELALAIHGQVDPVTGVSQTMPQAPWKEPVEIKYLLEEKLDTRVLLDNDCVMLALAEKWQNAENSRDFCVINVDYGIGSSFVINRQIYRGSLYGSGQIGHTIVNPDGAACDCGRYGCLETVASLTALKKRVRTWYKSQPPGEAGIDWDTLTSAQLIKRYHEGDRLIQGWVEQAANAIGLSLYNFLNILNINQIYFYGRCCAFGDRWLQSIIRQTGANPFDSSDPHMVNATHIGFGQLSRTQQVMGIGYLYAEKALAGV